MTTTSKAGSQNCYVLINTISTNFDSNRNPNSDPNHNHNPRFPWKS